MDKLKSYKNTFKINQKRPKEQPQHISILPVCVGGGGSGGGGCVVVNGFVSFNG